MKIRPAVLSPSGLSSARPSTFVLEVRKTCADMKLGRKLLAAFATLVLVVGGIMIGYVAVFSMDKGQSLSVNDSTLSKRVLLATQGSKFKDEVLRRVVADVQGLPVYVQVIDVFDLPAVHPEEWNNVIVFHTWEVGEPPAVVTEFEKHCPHEKLFDVTTSGDGHYHLEGVDGITSASAPVEAARVSGAISQRIKSTLEP